MDTARIVVISSLAEALFLRKFLGGMVSLAFNSDFTALSPDPSNVFVYPHNLVMSSVLSVLSDPTIIKLVSKPMMAINKFYNVLPTNIDHLSIYLQDRDGSGRSIPEMKREIVDTSNIEALDQRAAAVALIMSKYRAEADKMVKQSKKKSYFNKRRDCYALYLTIYNDILSTNGPLPFSELVNLASNYPSLCRIERYSEKTISPAMALNGLIKVGALANDRYTSMVSIPDQIPPV